MLKLFWEFTSMKEKIFTLVGIFLLFFITGCIIKHQHTIIQNQNKYILTLEISNEYNKVIFDEERRKFIKSIDEQNTIIENLKFNENNYRISLQEFEKKLAINNTSKQIKILRDLEINNSIENKYKIMSDLLQEFSDEEIQ